MLRPALPSDPNPYADWSSHLFLAERTQYVPISNAATLYSDLIPGQSITRDDIR